MKAMPSCASLAHKMRYIDGHDHNNIPYSDGWKIGGNGYDGGHGNGKVGQLYVKTSDSGQVQAWYMEFSNSGRSDFDSLVSCVRSRGIDNCLDRHDVYLWFDSGPPSPSCQTMRDRDCYYKDQHASCGDRISWVESHNGVTWEEAYAQVQQECGSQCSCDIGPTMKPTSPPPTPSVSCDEMLRKQACDTNGCYSCGDRITYLEQQQYMTPAQAYAQVAREFPDTCVCSNPPRILKPVTE